MSLPFANDIIALAEAGCKRREIAEKIGCGIDQVYGVIARARQRGHDIPRVGLSGNAAPVRLSPGLRCRLSDPAAQRGLQPHELAARILEVAISDGLIDSILDDAEDLDVTETPKGEGIGS